MDVVQGGCLGALKLHVRVRVSSKRRRVSMCAGAIIHTSLLAVQRVFGERERERRSGVYVHGGGSFVQGRLGVYWGGF